MIRTRYASLSIYPAAEYFLNSFSPTTKIVLFGSIIRILKHIKVRSGVPSILWIFNHVSEISNYTIFYLLLGAGTIKALCFGKFFTFEISDQLLLRHTMKANDFGFKKANEKNNASRDGNKNPLKKIAVNSPTDMSKIIFSHSQIRALLNILT